MANAHVMLAGLPGSGKTTYLAALWHQVRTQTGSTRFTLQSEPDPRDYFYDIERQWLGLKKLERSVFAEPRAAQLPLLNREKEAIELDIPDIPGETYRHLWETGTLSPSVQDIAQSADGIILFLRADALVRVTLVEDEMTERDTDKDATVEVNPWTRAIAPTQAKLCDLLETLESIRQRLPRIAVAISAWDKAIDTDLEPDAWLEINTPLLWQFLASRGDAVAFEIFGVSAQGGDVDDPTIRENLAAIDPPGERVTVWSDAGITKDIAEPLEWLLGQGAVE
jgi:hypothetical protein